MKYIQFAFLFICLFSTTLIIKAQQNHFIYIQTDNKQPFYIKMDNKIYSSSISGYVILSKLKPDLYDFLIGFPKNEWPEQNLQCTILNKDLGFALKNYGNEGWGLLNLKTLNIIKASNNQNLAINHAASQSDSFSNMLSSVVNDPSIKEVTKLESPVVLATKVINTRQLPIPIIENAIIKKQSVKSKNGLEMIYLDSMNGVRDTIHILIPIGNDMIVNKEVKLDTLSKIEKEIVPSQQTTIAAQKDTKFLNIELPNPSINQVVINKNIDKPIASPIVNSDCKIFASEDDFMKLRKKMASANNAEMMITSAKKVFKIKCFSTEQVKNLSVLFLKNEGKYAFFDSVYPFVSDAQNFPTLQYQLSDTYYIDRFKVMIRH